MNRAHFGLASSIIAVTVVTSAQAVLVYNGPDAAPTATRQFVTDAPITPPPAGTGSQFVGRFGSFSGVAISPTHFITAKHFGVSSTFIYDGTTYNVGTYVDDPSSDLRIVSVVGDTFDTYANLYDSTDEVGKQTYVFGRGRPAGSLVSVSGDPKGWKIDGGGLDAKLSWGTDIIDGTAYSGTTLAILFTPTDGSLSLTEGDSGGGMFIFQDGKWKLAGIHYSITSPFSQNADGSGAFNATIFDASGLYYNIANPPTPPNWVSVTGPGASYSTRISTRLGWISSVVPEPASLGLLGLGVVGLMRRRRQMC